MRLELGWIRRARIPILAAALVCGGILAALAGPSTLVALRGRVPADESAAAVLRRTAVLFGFGLCCLGGYLALRLVAERRAKKREGQNGGPEPRERRGALRLGRAERVMLAAPAAACLALGLSMADRSLTYDEILQMELDVRRPYPAAFLPHGVFANHPLATSIAKVADRIGGSSESNVRLPFVLLAALAAGGTTMLALRSTGSSAAGFLAGAFVVANPTFLGSALTIRGYAPLVFGAAAIGLTAGWRRDREDLRSSWQSDRLRGLETLLFSLMAAASHLFGLVYVALLLLADLAFRRRSLAETMTLDRAALATVGVGLGWLLWAPSLPWLFLARGGTEGGMPSWEVPNVVVTLLTGGARWPIDFVLAGLFTALASLGWRRLRFGKPSAAAVALVVLSCIGALLLRPPFFEARFLLAALPGLAVLAAAGASGKARSLVGAGLLAVGVYRSFVAVDDRPNLRGAIEQLAMQVDEETAWCTTDIAEEFIVLRHYARGRLQTCSLAGEVPREAIWLALAGQEGERRISASEAARFSTRLLLRVGGGESDLVAWVPGNDDGKKSRKESPQSVDEVNSDTSWSSGGTRGDPSGGRAYSAAARSSPIHGART